MLKKHTSTMLSCAVSSLASLLVFSHFQTPPAPVVQTVTKIRIPQGQGVQSKYLSGTQVVVPEGLTDRQAKILTIAYRVGKESGFSEQEIRYMQGILMQETKAGTYPRYKVAGHELGADEKYYGVGQMKLTAAKEILKKRPELGKEYLTTDQPEEIVANLILNDEFAIRMTAAYLDMMRKRYNRPIDNRIVTAYNQGPTGATRVDTNTWHYTVKVRGYASSPEIMTLNKTILASM